jgi:hypothetical protein
MLIHSGRSGIFGFHAEQMSAIPFDVLSNDFFFPGYSNRPSHLYLPLYLGFSVLRPHPH